MPTLDELLREVSRDDRACPQPDRWNRLWEDAANKRQTGMAWDPPLPLILAAWGDSTDTEKRERFHQHIRWAHEHGVLAQVASVIFSLKPNDWHKGS